jgi:SAM-dependent methyltransferase
MRPTPLPQSRPRLPFVLCLAAVTVAGVALAQEPGKQYEPRRGQAGKDVVWVPTEQALVDKMLDMAKAAPGDYVIDLGSGDGRTVITAAKRGIKAHGVEYNPDMVALSRQNAEKAGVTDKATFANADIFETDFSQATVVTLFLLPALNVRLRPTILKMKPGTRVVSNTFDMGDWQADSTEHLIDCQSFCRAYLWIVPAQVEGVWQLGDSELSIEQKYQTFTGKLTTGNVIAPVKGRLDGDRITFTAAGTEYSGRVTGNAMEGTAKPSEAAWKAVRK